MYHLDDEDISVVSFDWKDHMSRVSFVRAAALTFHAVLRPDLPAVDNLDFVGASDASQPFPDRAR